MNKIFISSIPPNTYFTAPVFLDDKFILLSQDTPAKESLIHRLRTWGYSYVFSEGQPTAGPAIETLTTKMESTTISMNQDVKEQDHLKETEKFFNELLDFIERLFTDFVTKNELSISKITEEVKELIAKVKDQRNYILRLADLSSQEKNYIVIHTAKTSILAIALGMQMKLPPHKLIELGMAALLHEIGMIRLPPQLYMSNRLLTSEEKRAITAHPIIGFKILKSFSFPVSVSLTVLEHHEHMDGTGYPQRLSGERISLPARILAVAGSYAALVSRRPYRPGKDGHSSLLDLLRGSGTQYDENVLKALIFCISLYPIGSYVQLANGSKGIVVEPNVENPRFPLVKVYIADTGDLLKEPILVKTNAEESKIVKILTKEEIMKINPDSVQLSN
ncbi:MAG TPA: HD-GYP domain-containing protein [Spirochaetales bacterium]|nr:HD-GYP domain-containing protein [Spirochaetales bacterium]